MQIGNNLAFLGDYAAISVDPNLRKTIRDTVEAIAGFVTGHSQTDTRSNSR